MTNLIFDDKGNLMEITNIEQYLTLQIDEDIEHTYVVNCMWHMENKGLEWLVKNGHGEAKGKPYPSNEIDNTINIIKKFMIENYNYTDEGFKKLEDKALEFLKQL